MAITPSPSPKRNLVVNPQPVQIHDIRGRESDFTLDHDAFFPILPAPSTTEGKVDFDDETSITNDYYPKVTALLLHHVSGATRVVIFDHTIRRAGATARRAPRSTRTLNQTAKSVVQRIRRHCPDEADDLLAAGTRYRIINVWRSLNKGPVESSPLAFASSASFPHHLDQKWYYWSGMTPDERLLLECFDSESLRPAGESQVQGGRDAPLGFRGPADTARCRGAGEHRG
ncbi:methyltransferase [Apiospora phragmitis]|uniref:Methyltransferase n=1 Tax=Apiospora phragmitis TaxID=2905665 RepID=A0ABR1WSS0_9PEZI